MCTIFKVFVDFVTILLLGLLFVLFCSIGHRACGILAPQPGIKLTHHAMQSEVLTSGLPGKSPPYSHFIDKETEARRNVCDLLTFIWFTSRARFRYEATDLVPALTHLALLPLLNKKGLHTSASPKKVLLLPVP